MPSTRSWAFETLRVALYVAIPFAAVKIFSIPEVSNAVINNRRYLVQKETDPIHEAMLQRKITPEEGRELFKRRRELLEQQNSQAAGGAQQSDGTAAK